MSCIAASHCEPHRGAVSLEFRRSREKSNGKYSISGPPGKNGTQLDPEDAPNIALKNAPARHLATRVAGISVHTDVRIVADDSSVELEPPIAAGTGDSRRVVMAHPRAVIRWGFYKARRIGPQSYPNVCSPQIDSRPNRRGYCANFQGAFLESRSLTAEHSIHHGVRSQIGTPSCFDVCNCLTFPSR